LLFLTPATFDVHAQEAQETAAEPPSVAESRVIRIGLLDFEGAASYSRKRDRVQPAIVDYVRRRFPDYDVRAYYLTTPELANAVKDSRVEFFLASSGFYVAMLRYGVRDIATLISPNYPDPNRVVAGTMFVRSDRPDAPTLESIQGLRGVSTHPLNFMTYQINLGEIALEGYDPDRFFSSIAFTDNDPREVMNRVLSGEADVGMLRHCMLEAISAMDKRFEGRFKIVNRQDEHPEACAASTRLYPGWTMAVTPRTPPQLARDLAESLLRMQPQDTSTGYTWSIATDFKRVNSVLKILRVGPYSHLREWTLKGFLIQIWPFLGFFAGLMIAAAWHFWRVKKLVIRRTAQLSEALEREREADRRAREVSLRLDSLQRVSAIGQLSSIFVHELGQPLSAMRYGVRGLQTLLSRLQPLAQNEKDAKNMAGCIAILDKQLTKSAEIIDRVRSYAKQTGDRNAAVNFRDVVKETIQEFRDSRKAPDCLVLQLPDYPLVVTGNAVELKLIVLNLVKNAAEEVACGIGSPFLLVDLAFDAVKHRAILTVANSGRILTDADLTRLREPLKSSKNGGLGLGVLIITSIAEAHRAHVQFEARRQGGLRAVFSIAIREDTEPARLAESGDTEFGDRF
ncbi:MAG: PhnD/SsuA/transferrin family substrate-binding protein, partial [Duodenibacillus sp.]